MTKYFEENNSYFTEQWNSTSIYHGLLVLSVRYMVKRVPVTVGSNFNIPMLDTHRQLPILTLNSSPCSDILVAVMCNAMWSLYFAVTFLQITQTRARHGCISAVRCVTEVYLRSFAVCNDVLYCAAIYRYYIVLFCSGSCYNEIRLYDDV